MRPWAREISLSQGSACKPRVEAGGCVERHVVLHRPEVGQAQLEHLGALPVLLEPAPGVAVQRQVEDQQPGDRGLAHRHVGHH